MLSTRVTSAPAKFPLTDAEARQYARVGTDEEMAELGAILRGATAFVEGQAERALITRTCEVRLPRFWPCGLALSLAWPPLQSVTSVKYLDQDEVEQTVDPSVYVVDTHRYPGQLRLARNQVWPTAVAERPDAVRIVYKAGYADTPEELQEEAEAQGLLDAMRLTVSQRDEFRNSLISGTIVAEVPFGLRQLLLHEGIPDASESRVESLAA